MKEEVIKRLASVERDRGVSILYACESGSRAWGFDSPDSDYDVRFIYIHGPAHYLSFDVERQRDVIDTQEYPIVDEIDLAGWDLRKAMHLLTRTNGALVEWLRSPIVYVDKQNVASHLRAIIDRHFDAVALCYHYSHMARGNAANTCLKTK